MLETIREYALERLAEDKGAAELRRKHAQHFLRLAESEPVRGRRPGSITSTPSATTCARRLRGASRPGRSGSDCGSPPRCGSTGGSAASWPKGAAGSTRPWLAVSQRRPEIRARALHAAASLATRQGDYERAAELSEQSLALWEELGDVTGTARSLLSLGTVAAEQGDQRAGDLAVRARGRAVSRVRRPAGPCARGQQPRWDRARARRLREGRGAQRAGLRALRRRSRTAREWRSRSSTRGSPRSRSMSTNGRSPFFAVPCASWPSSSSET